MGMTTCAADKLYRVIDSGVRQEFETGAVRDTNEGKPDLGLLSPYVWGTVLSFEVSTEVEADIIDQLALWAQTGNVEYLLESLKSVRNELDTRGCNFNAALDMVKVLEAGASKYAPWNWAKGIPVSRTLSSCLRHYVAWVEDENSEDHLAHLGCNIMFLIHTQMEIEKGRLPKTLLDLPIFTIGGEA